MAASSDMFEIESSRLALKKSSNTSIQGFAQQMINDHTKATQNLKAAASQAEVTVPAEMMPKHAADLQALEGTAEANFDTAYIEAQEKAHDEALALMTGYAENGDNEALVAHAKTTAPVIKMHAEHVEKLEGGM